MGTIEPSRGATAAPRERPRKGSRLEGLFALAAGIASAVAPREPRERIVQRTGVNPTFWSSAFGLVQAIGCPLLLIDSFLRVVPGYVNEGTDAALAGGFENNQVDPLAVMWGGSFAWLRWLTSPFTMFLVLETVTGAVRLVSAALNGEAVGEPLAWLGWRLWRRLVVAPVTATRHAARYGPRRPDRVMPQPDGSLLVLSVQPHGEWNEHTTIEVGERFYRLAERGELREGSWLWHSARLREEDPSAVIRSLVRYESPDGARRTPNERPLAT